MLTAEEKTGKTDFYENAERLTRINWGLGDTLCDPSISRDIIETLKEIKNCAGKPLSRQRCYIAIMVYEVLNLCIDKGVGINSGKYSNHYITAKDLALLLAFMHCQSKSIPDIELIVDILKKEGNWSTNLAEKGWICIGRILGDENPDFAIGWTFGLFMNIPNEYILPIYEECLQYIESKKDGLSRKDT